MLFPKWVSRNDPCYRALMYLFGRSRRTVFPRIEPNRICLSLFLRSRIPYDLLFCTFVALLSWNDDSRKRNVQFVLRSIQRPSNVQTREKVHHSKHETSTQDPSIWSHPSIMIEKTERDFAWHDMTFVSLQPKLYCLKGNLTKNHKVTSICYPGWSSTIHILWLVSLRGTLSLQTWLWCCSWRESCFEWWVIPRTLGLRIFMQCWESSTFSTLSSVEGTNPSHNASNLGVFVAIEPLSFSQACSWELNWWRQDLSQLFCYLSNHLTTFLILSLSFICWLSRNTIE
jgi:hypothetical protein